VPWLTFLATVVGGVWALNQWTDEIHSARVKETLSFVRQFDITKEGKSLRATYERLIEEVYEVNKSAKGMEAPKNEGERAQRRELLAKRLVKNVESNNLQDDIKELLDFFTNVAICATHNVCDKKSTLLFFGQQMFDFLNNYCSYLEEYGKRWSTSFGDTIFYFLFENKFHETQKKIGDQYYFCERYRKIERQSALERWLGRTPN